MDHQLSIVLCYTSPNKEQRKTTLKKFIDRVIKEFSNVSKTGLYKKINMKFCVVDTSKVLKISEEHNLKKEPETAYLLLYKRGELQKKLLNFLV